MGEFSRHSYTNTETPCNGGLGSTPERASESGTGTALFTDPHITESLGSSGDLHVVPGSNSSSASVTLLIVKNAVNNANTDNFLIIELVCIFNKNYNITCYNSIMSSSLFPKKGVNSKKAVLTKVLVLAKNKKAFHNFAVLKDYSAGIKLKGFEVKAIKEGKTSFEGSYIEFIDGVLCVVNLYIGKYSKQSKEFNELDSKRPRQILLNSSEIREVARAIAEKGKTAVPLALVAKNGLIKLEFAVVRGRKEFEKKVVAKDRQVLKDLEIESKSARIY